MVRMAFAGLAAWFMLIVSGGPSRAETVNCIEIASVPTIITVQGVYCLKKNLASSSATGRMIEIRTNNVTIDLNGFKLGGLAAGLNTQAIGIYAVGRRNIRIANGAIRGFLFGIYLGGDWQSSSGHIVEGLTMDGNVVVAISVSGSGVIVRGNQILNTSNLVAPSLAGPGPGQSPAAASNTASATRPRSVQRFSPQNAGSDIASILLPFVRDSLVENNVIATSQGGFFTDGINVLGSSNVKISGNFISGIAGISYSSGVYLDSSASNILIENNRIIEILSRDSAAHGIESASLTSYCLGNTIIAAQTAQTVGCSAQAGTLP